MAPIKRITTPFSYSAAVQAGDYVFLGLHRGFGDSFAVQMEDALNGIKGTLAQLDIPLDHLVKIQVWLKNINDLQEMEKIVHTYFEADTFPARMTSTTEFIDADCLVMLEGVAYKGD
jgi:2-iminobutanoate/2-iminopropanoate deaminase